MLQGGAAGAFCFGNRIPDFPEILRLLFAGCKRCVFDQAKLQRFGQKGFCHGSRILRICLVAYNFDKNIPAMRASQRRTGSGNVAQNRIQAGLGDDFKAL